MAVNLAEMKSGQSGVITTFQGGPGFAEKLGHIGIRKGKEVKKISSIFRRGPVTILIDNFQVAIGYGKAVRIMVEVNSSEKNSPGR